MAFLLKGGIMVQINNSDIEQIIYETYDSLEKNNFSTIMNDITDEEHVFEKKRKQLLAANGLTEWIIQNDKFKEVIQRFTITSHKKAAGEIGGFAVEKGSAAGEITFF